MKKTRIVSMLGVFIAGNLVFANSYQDYNFDQVDEAFIKKFEAYQQYLKDKKLARNKRSQVIFEKKSKSRENSSKTTIYKVKPRQTFHQRRSNYQVKNDIIWSQFSAKNINLNIKLPQKFKKTWDTLTPNNGKIIFENNLEKVELLAFKNKCSGSPAMAQECFDKLLKQELKNIKDNYKIKHQEDFRTIQWDHSAIKNSSKNAKNSGRLFTFITSDNQKIINFIFLEPLHNHFWKLVITIPNSTKASLYKTQNYIKVITSLFKKEVKTKYKVKYRNDERTRKTRYTHKRSNISNQYNANRVSLYTNTAKNIGFTFGFPQGGSILADDLTYNKGQLVARRQNFYLEITPISKSCNYQSFNLIRKCIENIAKTELKFWQSKNVNYQLIDDKNIYLQLKNTAKQKSSIGRIITLRNLKTKQTKSRLYFQVPHKKSIWRIDLNDNKTGILENDLNLKKIISSFKFK